MVYQLNAREIVIGKQVARILDSVNRGHTLPIARFKGLLDELSERGQEYVMRAVFWDIRCRRGIQAYLTHVIDEPSIWLPSLDEQFTSIHVGVMKSLKEIKHKRKKARAELAGGGLDPDRSKMIRSFITLCNRKQAELSEILEAHRHLERCCKEGQDSTPELEVEMRSFMDRVNACHRPDNVSTAGEINLLAD